MRRLSPRRLLMLAAISCAAAAPPLATATPGDGKCPNSTFEQYTSGVDPADLNGDGELCSKTNSGHFGGVSIDNHTQSHSPH